MASGHVQGRLLKMFTHMIQPQLAVELGTFSGYSALCIAEGLPEGGMDYADRIRLHIGDARTKIPELGLKDIDMAFIDADKRHYTDFYEMLLPRMRQGGYILADNTLWYGHVIEEHTRESDLQTLGIKQFNDHLAKDNRVEKVIVPVRDGLTIIRVK